VSLPGRVVLVGSMGSGKSTVARRLAALLSSRVVDLDAAIEQTSGRRVAALFAEEGEARFRELEAAQLAAVLADPAPTVIAAGGGTLEAPGALELLAAADDLACVWLRVRPERAVERISDPSSRPLLAGDPLAAMRAISERRQAAWEAAASLVVDVDERSPDEVAAEIVRGLS
jgi:shikimate kinase